MNSEIFLAVLFITMFTSFLAFSTAWQLSARHVSSLPVDKGSVLSSVNLLAYSVHSGSYRSSKMALCRKYGLWIPISAQLSLISQKAQFSRSVWQALNSRHICCGKHPALVMAEQLNLVYVRFSMGKSAPYRYCCFSTESRDLGGNCQWTKPCEEPNFHRVGTQT